jgi:hypothetical protein
LVYALVRGYVEAKTDTTQQSGQTPDKEVKIKNFTVYVSGYLLTPWSRVLLEKPTSKLCS